MIPSPYSKRSKDTKLYEKSALRKKIPPDKYDQAKEYLKHKFENNI